MEFMPRGQCYLWRDDLLALMVGADALMTLSFLSFPLVLSALIRKRRDAISRKAFLLLVCSLFLCAVAHLAAIWNVWHGHYHLEGLLKSIAAVSFAASAVATWLVLRQYQSESSFWESRMVRETERCQALERQLVQVRSELETHQEARFRESRKARVTVERAVAEHRRCETNLKRTRQDLESVGREMESFAFVASHDLREPLRKIRAFGDLLMSRDRFDLSDGEQREYLGYMVGAAERMNRLLDGLLRYSRITTRGAPFQRTRLALLIEEVHDDLDILISESRAHIEWDVGDVELEVDPAQIRQLLEHLIKNAIKYGKPDTQPRIEGRVRANGETLLLELADNGIGFEERHAEKIFEVFRRLHGRDRYEGIGMGLAMCRKIVQRHHGRIWAEAKPGEGAQFFVELPRHHGNESHD
ncbi:sensor histidine kinase [Sulfidibacter corallicola]|uniref:sensor histidine kinase n=1 Tax=Sulfidibacter corallicola TaxID=2818388 RepID=UPI001F395BD3|nr:ATP-binding protein [Sulfidibacter corallicola]